MKCPKCASENVTHSHRRGMEKIVRYVYPRVPYRCKECWTRFWKFENPMKTLASKAMLILFILLIAGACVWFFGLSEEEQTPPPKPQPIKKSIPQRKEIAKTEKSEGPEKTKQEDSAKTSEPSGPSDTKSEKQTKEPEKLPAETPAELPATSDKAPIAPADKPETPKTPADKSEVSVTEPDGKSEKSEMSADKPETSADKPETPADKPEMPTDKPETPDKPEASADKPETVTQPETPAEMAQPESSAEPAVATKPRKRTRRTLNIQHQSSDEEFRLELLSDGPVEKYKHFTIPSPPKMVIDLPGKWRYSGRYTIKVESDMVRRVRVGKHSKKLRLVLDMKAKIKSSPVFEETPEGLAVVIKK